MFISNMNLYGNGALDPDQWKPAYDNHTGTCDVVGGMLVGWRYGVWRVTEVNPIDDVDLTDKDREHLDQYLSGYRPDAWAVHREQFRPRHVVIRHESGPMILKPGERSQRLHDGTRTLHFTYRPLGRYQWAVLPEPYQTCSCHGHVWPCQEIDQAALAAHHAVKLDKLMATAAPGVCAHCLEPISSRQKTVTFPEPSRLVPGAPGPTFHAGRGGCWGGAETYERTGRLTDQPDIARLASCPGVRIIHEAHGMPTDLRLECTAGLACTGLHGPAGYRQDMPCWHMVRYADDEPAFVRPPTDCGYRTGDRGCLGQYLGPAATNEIAADLMWRVNHRPKGGHGD